DAAIRFLMDVNECETFRRAVQDGTIHIRKWHPKGLNLDALLVRLSSRQADTSDFGIGVGTPGDDPFAPALPAKEEGVTQNNSRHFVGGVGELIGTANVTGGVDAGVGRLKEVVDL